LTEARILKAQQLFDRYGIWVVAVGRLFAGIRGAMVVAAGATRFNFIKFIIADGLAAIVSGGMFIAVGYYLGRTLDDVDEIRRKMKPYEHWVILGLVLVVLLVILYILWQRGRETTIAEVAAGKVIKKAEARDEAKSLKQG
jgi:membrane protein DedA with SNARE-associated domain